jgi:phenylalanyl-tRNA synthetase beta chain
MKVSYNWLKDYVDTRLSAKEVARVLTNTGLEVEGMEEFSPVEGGLEGLVVGRVTSCVQHPNADKLSLTTVDIGEDRELPIICGAPNVAEGQKVVVAPVGTVLNMNGKPTELKKTKIRGEVSEGMICAEDEVGLGDSHEGIIVLDDDAPVGQPLKDFYNIEKDTVLEFDLTPNRIDGASHIGAARDLAAYLNMQEPTPLYLPEVESLEKETEGPAVEVEVADNHGCPRYSGVTIKGVKTGPSPEWLQNRLKAVGLNPINNLVDISNYVLMETGHPLHFFDADKIAGNKVIVQRLPEGTPFKTLDGEERKLSGDDLMICDAEKPIGIAGVLGGSESGVTGQTTNLFIESAYFNPKYIRNTAKRHMISTDASYRFERGADPNNTLYALKRAASMVRDIAGGSLASDIVDHYPEPSEPARVHLNLGRLRQITGQAIDERHIRKILESLDIRIIQASEKGLDLSIPTYRVDVTREVDVIEEILRIYGFNQIHTTEKLNTSLTYSEGIDKEKYTEAVPTLLTGKGFYEIMSNSLTKSDYYKNLETYPDSHLVYLHNPLSQDLNSMRQTLLFGGLEAIAHNINRQRPNLKLFELGNCYARHPQKAHSDDALQPYEENAHLGLFMTGAYTRESWMTGQDQTSFFHLKGTVEALLAKLGFEPRRFKKEEVENDVYAQALRYKIKKHTIAEVGMVHEGLLQRFDIETPVFYGDLHWDQLLQHAENNVVEYEEIPKYPEVRRDLALLVDQDVRFDQIEELAYQSERKVLREVNLFDVYQGEKLGANKKSYAVSFILRDEKQTLKDKQIEKVMNKLIKTFREKLGAEIR